MILLEVLAAVGALGAGCRASFSGEVPSMAGALAGTKFEAEVSTTTISGPPGSCVTVVFLGEDGEVLGHASGGVPLTLPTPAGTAQVRVEPCPESRVVASPGRAPLRSPYPFLSFPSRLSRGPARFLLATVEGRSHHDAEGMFARREEEWTATPPSPHVTVDMMMEAEVVGSDLLIHVVAQDEIQRLDLQWNDSSPRSLDDAVVSELNGWHVASFLIPAQEIELPTSASVENILRYEMDTLQRSGLSFDASVALDP